MNTHITITESGPTVTARYESDNKAIRIRESRFDSVVEALEAMLWTARELEKLNTEG